MSQLALYEHAKEALAAAVRIDEVVDIRSDAERAKAYARIARDRRLQADAAELGARAERKLGILLRKAKEGGLLSQGGRPAERSNLTEPETGADGEPVFDHTPFTLADIGVDKKLSSRAQKLADLGDDDFESVVSDKREKILASDAPVVSAPRTRAPKADKPAKVAALEPRRFHQFTFSLLTMALAMDRVSSTSVLFLARECGIVGAEETPELTPEAEMAMGNIVVAALSALDRGRTEVPEILPDILERANLREAYEGEVALLVPQKGRLIMQTAEAAMRAGYAAEVPLAVMCQDLGHPHGTLATWANRLGLTNVGRMHATQKRFGGAA